MTIAILATAYLGVAVFVAACLAHAGIADRPRTPLFSAVEYATLGLATLLVAALWILFLPGLLVQAFRAVRRRSRIALRTWPHQRPRQHAGGWR